MYSPRSVRLTCITYNVLACDRTVFVWSIKTGALLQQLQFTEHGSATDVCWAERHRKLALLIACADGTLHIYVKVSTSPIILIVLQY